MYTHFCPKDDLLISCQGIFEVAGTIALLGICGHSNGNH